MSKILVTGGVGFIGTNVCLEAISRGHDVLAFDNFVRPLVEENADILKSVGVRTVRGDVRNPTDLDKLPWVPDAIVHLAGPNGIPYGQTNPKYDFDINVVGTINILEYSRLHGKPPVLLASSNKVYSSTVDTVSLPNGVPEDFPIDGGVRSIYGASKLSADFFCQEYFHSYGVPTVMNRMSSIYGYYQKPNEEQGWVSWFIGQITKGLPINIFGTGNQRRDMLFGTDCARLYLDQIKHIDKVKGQAYNVGGGVDNNMSLLEAVKEIEKQTGKTAKLRFLPESYGNQETYISDISKITQTLDWRPIVSPQGGIKRILSQ